VKHWWRIFLFFLIAQGMATCASTERQPAIQDSKAYAIFPELALKYAKGFTIGVDSSTGYRLLGVGTDPTITYCLIPKNNESPTKNQLTLQVPVKRFGLFSTTHIHMMECLGELESIIGVEQKTYIYNAQLQQQIKNGTTSELGEMSVLNIEKTLTVDPEMIIYIGYTNSLPVSLEKIQEFGIPCLPNFDWQEEHPLARAEWIKFFGVLTGKERLADSLFSIVEKNYLSYSEQAKHFVNKPTVLFSSLYNGTWYIPGGKSYMATLLKDAGGSYPWAASTDYGSLPLSFETVANQLLHHDIWINPDIYSLDEIIKKDSRYTSFLTTNPQHMGVYQYDKRKLPQGGNDYYETGAFRVDLILRDMIIMLHPNWLSADSLYFYRKLN
jgi:iron complex transport system substrate-binding protein